MQWRQKKVVSYLLHQLEPALFPVEPTNDAWFTGKEIDLLCFALRVHPEAFLPTETRDIDNIIAALSAVTNQQCKATGRPISHVRPDRAPQQLLEGAFPRWGETYHMRARNGRPEDSC